jgi:uncharacterized caspase-like protein
VLTGSLEPGVANESSELEGGVFTHFLLRGLSGDADLDADRTISAAELGRYVIDQVTTYGASEGRTRQSPQYWLENAAGELPILGEGAVYSEVTGLIVGVSTFATSDLASLAYAAQDAERVYALFSGTRLPSSRLRYLINDHATQSQFLKELDSTASEARKDSLFVVYYSGHGVLTRSGELALMAIDSDSRREHSLVKISFIKSLLERSKAVAKTIFLDAFLSKPFTVTWR